MRDIEDTLQQLPEVPENKPVEQMTTAELLHANVRRGLQETLSVLSQPMKVKQSEDDDLSQADLKLQRLKVDATTSAARLLANIQQAALQANSGNKALEDLLRKAQEHREKEARAKAEKEARAAARRLQNGHTGSSVAP